jgi:ABC-2 type transport system permease protein
MRTDSLTERLRIILALAGKDMVDALRNKILLTIILGVALVMAQGKALPLLLKLSDTVQVAVWQPDSASVRESLIGHEGIRVAEATSQHELEQMLVEASGAILGIVVPAEFDPSSAPTDGFELDGYYPYWMSAEEVVGTATLLEDHLSSMSGAAIDIDTAGHVVYAQADSGGQLFMTALVMVLITMLICMIIVPYLMIEEKEARTIDSLLVSPARIGEIVLGKALVGMTYGLLAGAVVMAFNHTLIVTWWIAIAACVVGSLFAVAWGMLLGSLFENVATMNLWMSLLLAVLVAPVMALILVTPEWPAILRAVLPWFPTVALYKTFILSFTAVPSLAQVWANLGLVAGTAVLVLAIVAGIVRRSDR